MIQTRFILQQKYTRLITPIPILGIRYQRQSYNKLDNVKMTVRGGTVITETCVGNSTTDWVYEFPYVNRPAE